MNLRLAHIGLYLEFSQQSVYDDFQMQLTHTGDDSLTGFPVGIGFERRIFFS